jgi:peptidoglycan/LPS O-acetylase OafA/YrhL
MPPSQFFVTCAISFLAGILLASLGLDAWWPWPVSLNVAAGCCAGFSLILILAELAESRGRQRRLLVVASCALFFFGGVLRFELAKNQVNLQNC